MHNNIQLIIPMSGMGNRFVEAGYSDPKPLIVVDGKPIIQHIVELFTGVSDVIFICNNEHLANTNMRETLLGIVPTCKIVEVSTINQKGPVDAVLKAKDIIDNDRPVIVSYCDYGTVWNFKKFLKYVESEDLDGAIPSYIGFHPHMLGKDNYAFCKTDANGLLKQIKEKEPFTNNKMEEYASNGTYYFKSGTILKKYFSKLVNKDIQLNGEYYVSLVYNLLVEDGLKVGIFEIDKMLQWGTPYDLEVYKGWSNYFKNIKTWSLTSSCPKDTTLILPMAGKGSRFSELGYDTPKPILPVNGNPMIVEAVECLPKTDNKTFITLSEHVIKYNIDDVLKEKYNECNVITIDSVTEGQACTCEIGINKINLNNDLPILISASDNGILYDNEKIQKLLNDETVDIIVWSFRNSQSSKLSPNSYAWLDVDSEDKIRHVSCKKFIYDDPLKTHAIVGTMFFRKAKYFTDGLNENYKLNFRTNGEFYVDDVINRCIDSGLNVKVFECENYICWGTPNDYRTYNYWKEYFK